MTFDAREKSTYQGAPVECYRFAHLSTVWAWTSAETAITIPAGTFEPEAGLSRGEIDHSEEDGAGSIEVRVPIDNPVAQLFASDAPLAPITLTLYQTHRGDAEVVTGWLGAVGSVTFVDGEARMRCEPISAMFDRLVPALPIKARCPYDLYGAGCGVDRTGFRNSILVTTVSGNQVNGNFSVRPDGWFTTGYLEDLDGNKYWIVSHVGNAVVTMTAPNTIHSGDTIGAYAGCDRSEATCSSKFSNLPRHIGFPRMPTRNPFAVRLV